MPNSRAVTSKLAVQECLPDLNVSDSRTKSSALHDVYYVGPLSPWPNFLGHVGIEFRTHDWARNRHHLYLELRGEPGPHSLLKQQSLVGNEPGVQGRWQSQLAEVMTTVFHEQQFQMTFADFVCSGKDYTKVPDFVVLKA
ncbi:hypothetical protein OAory_01076080 [Aspergillus oryzae]|uniref:Unnamed protein product n=1 Tax=Aspergillus oryzae TaxID=5062 RepID=A0A1S9DPX9_ASPOZ|nr:hypothetical protein OAory_01076080 [Aspergillus oryzae]GMG29967.1 unnamed protein product [Aspergillus oryzae]